MTFGNLPKVSSCAGTRTPGVRWFHAVKLLQQRVQGSGALFQFGGLEVVFTPQDARAGG